MIKAKVVVVTGQTDRKLLSCLRPRRSRSGGILLGVDLSVFDIGAIDQGIFMLNSPLDTSQLTSSLSFILFMDRHNHKTRAHFLLNSLIPA
jgi:hypothetical protein